MTRLQDVKRLYAALSKLQRRLGDYQSFSTDSLPNISGRGGVYFFFEPGEERSESGSGGRVVRVGKAASLRARIYAHVGAASLIGPTKEGSHPHFHWYVQDALDTRRQQLRLGGSRGAANDTISAMPFLWLPVDEPQERVWIETNAVRLFSNFGREWIDSASPTWLGSWSTKIEIQQSHLWNVQNVKSHLRGRLHEPEFLDRLSELIASADLS